MGFRKHFFVTLPLTAIVFFILMPLLSYVKAGVTMYSRSMRIELVPTLFKVGLGAISSSVVIALISSFVASRFSPRTSA